MFRHVLRAMDDQIANADSQGLVVKEFRVHDQDWRAIAAFLEGHPFLASEIPGGKRYRGVQVEICQPYEGGFLVAELSDGRIVNPDLA
ncbi:hypothetical protein [Novosphingobium sp. BL-8A]|uniref:hypothetical protein n=1 Tax=Novosphingobium sp. BL-8A TaxID=3127639 RepID=UPI00375652BD